MSLNNQDLIKHDVILENCGPISVYVQGDKEKAKNGVVFLTVHDLGHSYMHMVNFVNLPEMEEVKKRCLFVHVSVPGQEPGAPNLPSGYQFPTMQNLGLDLITVLDMLRIKQVVLLGDGAGANILIRFAMWHPSRTHGLIAINCSAVASLGRFMDKLKDRIKRMTGETALNEKNVNIFGQAYAKRKDVFGQLKEKMKVDVLLLTGMKSKYLQDTENIHRELPPGICSMIKFEDCYDILKEAPLKATNAIVLFCQGQGLMSTAPSSVSRQTSLAGSDSSDSVSRSSSIIIGANQA